MPGSPPMYLHGCNYPWSTDGTTVFYGLDFGGNVWGSHLGISTRRAAIERDFAAMAALGFIVVRWFVFCDGRSGIVYDEQGIPAGHDAFFFADLDAALEIAAGAGIRLDLVLLDHRWMFSGLAETIADPVTGVVHEARLPQGRAHVLHAAAGRDALFEQVISPLVCRYGRSGARRDLGAAIAAYEFMNEPDFIVDEWERDLSSRVRRPLPFEMLASLVARLSDVVHAEHPGVLAMLGGARAHNLWAWDDDALGLDALQVHLYPDVRNPVPEDDIVGTAAGALGVRRPVILGELVAPQDTPLDDYLEFALSAGYLGAWPWSFSGTDAYGSMPAEPLLRFGERHPDLVNARFQSA